MSTRSLTHIKDNGKTLVTFYRHSDGYPEGHGKELAKFLDGFSIVNGLSLRESSAKVANGMSCLAAAIIKEFKDGPGEIYIYPVDSSDCGEEYVYTVDGKAGEPVTLTIAEDDAVVLFEGTAAEVLKRMAVQS